MKALDSLPALRERLSMALAVAGVVCSWLAPTGGLPECLADDTEAARPNIVLIMADDLGWSDIGCYGGEIPTPHIDALAAGGLRFTQFYNNAVCGPTRASLLTGLYCQQVGHRGDRWNEPKDFSRCATFAEVLGAAGYHTAMVGKWQGRDQPTERGFDRFFGPMCQGKISYFEEVADNPFYLNGQRWPMPTDGSFYLTDAFNDYAKRFAREAIEKSQRDEQPFLLYVAHIAPHWPLHAREEAIAAHRQRYLEHGWAHWQQQRRQRQIDIGLIDAKWPKAPKPDAVTDWNTDPDRAWQAERMAVYAAQVAAIDAGVGQILDALHEAGNEVERNTLVIFLSDNGAAPDGGVRPSKGQLGFSPGAKSLTQWRPGGTAIRPGSGPSVLPGPADTFAGYGIAWAHTGNTPFRNAKSTSFEGGIRTPMIARWPAGIDAAEEGSLRDPIGHVIDFMPTFIDLAGADYPARIGDRRPLPLEGISLRPALRNEPGGSEGHRQLCWSVPRGDAIRMGDWKLVSNGRTAPWALFDLAADATESRDLAATRPQLVNDMASAWKTWARRCGVAVPDRRKSPE